MRISKRWWPTRGKNNNMTYNSRQNQNYFCHPLGISGNWKFILWRNHWSLLIILFLASFFVLAIRDFRSLLSFLSFTFENSFFFFPLVHVGHLNEQQQEYEKYLRQTGEMIQLDKGLAWKHKDPNSIPRSFSFSLSLPLPRSLSHTQIHTQSQCLLVQVCNLMSGEVKKHRCWGSLVSHLSIISMMF